MNGINHGHPLIANPNNSRIRSILAVATGVMLHEVFSQRTGRAGAGA